MKKPDRSWMHTTRGRAKLLKSLAKARKVRKNNKRNHANSPNPRRGVAAHSNSQSSNMERPAPTRVAQLTRDELLWLSGFVEGLLSRSEDKEDEP